MFQSANANSTYFYSRQPYFDAVSSRLSIWTKQHGLPPFTEDEISMFLHQQWHLHNQELQNFPRFSFQKDQASSKVDSWVSHSTSCWSWTSQVDSFLPMSVFSRSMEYMEWSRTFPSPGYFFWRSRTSDQPLHAHQLQQKYKWSINSKSTLPYGFVFLKKTKQFLKGRSLISYYNSRYGRLLRVTARTIDSMVLQLWPQTMSQLAVPQIWSRVHGFFRDTPTEFNLSNINDDLVRFFNSVPQDRLLDAVNSLILHWTENMRVWFFQWTCHNEVTRFKCRMLESFTRHLVRQKWFNVLTFCQ